MSQKCYYGVAICHGHLWTCKTCKEKFCQTHWHATSNGRNVECVACERLRKEAADEAREAEALTSRDIEIPDHH